MFRNNSALKIKRDSKFIAYNIAIKRSSERSEEFGKAKCNELSS